MAKKKGSAVEDIVARQDHLSDIIHNFHEKNTFPSNSQLLETMRKKYKNYSRATFYRDLTKINRHNTFVQDIVESNFSAMVEKRFLKLEQIEEILDDWMKKSPTVSKTYYDIEASPDPNDPTSVKKIQKLIPREMQTETISPVTILQMQIDLQWLHLKILNGDIVDTSIALYTERFNEISEQLEKYQQQADMNALKS